MWLVGFILVFVGLMASFSFIVYSAYIPMIIGDYVFNKLILEHIIGLTNCEIYFQKECMEDQDFMNKTQQNDKTLNYFKLLLREERFYSPPL